MNPPIDPTQALVDITTAHSEHAPVIERLARMIQIENLKLRWQIAEARWHAEELSPGPMAPLPWENGP